MDQEEVEFLRNLMQREEKIKASCQQEQGELLHISDNFPVHLQDRVRGR